MLGLQDSSNTMVSFKQRIEEFTWMHYLFNIATGGLATLMGSLPYDAYWIHIIGLIVYFLNFGVLVFYTGVTISRAIMFPTTFYNSFVDKSEATFLPAYFLAWANILMGANAYGAAHVGPWLHQALRVFFWAYVGVTTIQAFSQYVWLFGYAERDFRDINPSWLLLIFPPMLVGSIASSLAPNQPWESARQMIVAGITYQALGFLASAFLYGLMVLRFSIFGLPPPSARPAMFIMVGPLAFTGLALIGLGNAAEEKFPEFYITHGANSGAVFRVIGLWFGIMCWMTCFWFFSVVLGCIVWGFFQGQMHFKLTWFGLVFPNVGFAILTIHIGQDLNSAAIKWIGEMYCPVLAAVYVILLLKYAILHYYANVESIRAMQGLPETKKFIQMEYDPRQE